MQLKLKKTVQHASKSMVQMKTIKTNNEKSEKSCKSWSQSQMSHY